MDTEENVINHVGQLPNFTISQTDVDRIIARIVKDHNVDHDWATRVFETTVQFLRANVVKGRSGMVPSQSVDMGWHTFLLYTRAYQGFCQSMDVPFIHHEPSDGPDAVRGNGYKDTIAYLRDLGCEVDNEMWPTQHGAECGGGDCDSCATCR